MCALKRLAVISAVLFFVPLLSHAQEICRDDPFSIEQSETPFLTLASEWILNYSFGSYDSGKRRSAALYIATLDPRPRAISEKMKGDPQIQVRNFAEGPRVPEVAVSPSIRQHIKDEFYEGIVKQYGSPKQQEQEIASKYLASSACARDERCAEIASERGLLVSERK